MAFPLPAPPDGVAYAVTAASEIFNAIWAHAVDRSAEFDTRMDATIDDVPSSVSVPSALITGIVTPDVPIPPAPFDPTTMQALYSSTADEITAMLTEGFATFIATYFPAGTYLEKAQAWIESVLAGTSTGVDPVVEQQLFQRDRSRVLADADRLTEEAMTVWAARGYPLPPGALAHQVALIAQDAQGKIADASSAAAIRMHQVMVENMRFAVERAIALRVSAVAAAGDYIRTRVLGPQVGASLASSLAEAQAQIARASTEFYRALIAAQEIPLRVASSNAEFAQRAQELQARLSTDLVTKRVDAAIAAAQLYSTQSAAAFNALNASSNISSSDSVSSQA
jgi:hypothetical protein